MDVGESKRTRGLICLALAVITVGVYWQVGGFDFVNYDDPDYVTGNSVVTSGLTPTGIFWAFTHFHAGNWHPLTWISHMVDCEFFGLHAGAHHWVNVAIHAANGVLLFLLLHSLTGSRWRSALVAALFAVHPLHVESVAWISERKDVLSTFFALLSLLAYASYVHQARAPGGRTKIRYALALIFFGLGLLAKPMLVTLPFLLLLLDFWPLARMQNEGWRTFVSREFGRLVWEKKLWFALAAASSVVTFCAQKTGGAILDADYFPLNWRVANAIISYFDYILKACWPVHLAVFYPLPHEQPVGRLLIAVAFLVIVSFAAVATMKRRPFFFVGWFWFLGTLVPVIGLVQVGGQAMADRYTYIPLTGFFITAVWGAAVILRDARWSRILAGTVSIIVLVGFASVTGRQLQYWRNSLALFNHALAVTQDNAPANNNLGTALAALGQRQDALRHYAKAVEIDPNNAHYQNNLATALARDGQRDNAVEHYLKALQINPRFAEVYSNLGALFLAEHRVGEAVTNLNESVQIEPGNAEMRNNLGNALSAAGRLDEALAQYSEAIRLNPAAATIRMNAGLALLKAGRTQDATAQFAEAARLNPASPEARYELGRQLFLEGQFQEAFERLAEAVKLRPDYVLAEFYQAAALGEMSRFDEATAAAHHALESAQRAGQTNLVVRIQGALESYKSGVPYRPKAASGN